MGLAQASARLESQTASGTSREVWKKWGGWGERSQGTGGKQGVPLPLPCPVLRLSLQTLTIKGREGAAGPGVPIPARTPKVGSQASELCGRALWLVGPDTLQPSTRLP